MKTFSKKLWLISTNKQVDDKILSEREVLDAINSWVNDLDGKSEQEIIEQGIYLKDEWFTEDAIYWKSLGRIQVVIRTENTLVNIGVWKIYGGTLGLGATV